MKITTKHIRNSLVAFVTHERSAVFFFLPSCCVSSLIFFYPRKTIPSPNIYCNYMRINKTVTCVDNPQTHTMSECVYKCHVHLSLPLTILLDQINVLILLLMFVFILFAIFCLSIVFTCVLSLLLLLLLFAIFFLDLVVELAL